MTTQANDAAPVPYLPSIGRLLGFASRAAVALSERSLAPHGLTLQQWILLTALWREDGLTVSQLAAYYRVSDPTASSLVDRMEAKGLVVRRRTDRDRRKVIVCLTEKGRSLAPLIGAYEPINDVLLAGFTGPERAALAALLDRLIANAESALAKAESG